MLDVMRSLFDTFDSFVKGIFEAASIPIEFFSGFALAASLAASMVASLLGISDSHKKIHRRFKSALINISTAFKAFGFMQRAASRILSLDSLTFGLSLFLGRDTSEDVIEQLMRRYEESWLPRYGLKRARFLFGWHATSVLVHRFLSLLWSPFRWILGLLGIRYLFDLIVKLFL